jgi:hypothetical protein
MSRPAAPLRASRAALASRGALALLVSLVSLGMGPCRGIPTFLVDADVDDDGLVTSADLDAVTACLGTEIPAPQPVYDHGGCPVRVPPTGCEAADIDRDGRVGPNDVWAVTARLGQTVCNGSEELCGRRFDQVAYPTTHNAMSARFDPYDYSILVSNQCSGIPTQLRDGIRALMLDIHVYQPDNAPPDLYLCHEYCDFGHQLLVDGLVEIREFLDTHRGAVVTFIIETDAETVSMEAQIRDAFAASGILPYARVQLPGEPWPTLGEMVAANERLVVLTDDPTPHDGCDADGQPCDWYLYLWSRFAFETAFTYLYPSDFSCAHNRGTPGNDLFILNHFLTRNTGAPQFAQMVNPDPVLDRRARDCWVEQAHIPNFVTVDFYEIGGVLRAANLLNYLWGQTDGAPPP